jgi:HD-like signal output (HDOD) protein
MPGLDGEALLGLVRAQWPTTLRVMLSGQVQQAATERWSTLAQHFVPKPVKATTLYVLIEQALKSRERLTTPELRTLVGQLGTLPALPTVFTELTTLTALPHYQFDDVVALVQRDPGVSADVLKLVNSVWFGLPKPVSSLREAVRAVGINPLRTLVLTAGVFSGDTALCNRLMREAMGRHAYLRALVRSPKPAWFEVALTTAVLCDVARLVLPQQRADALARCEALVKAGQRRVEAEQACLGADHALIGAVLLGEWGLPAEVVDAVATHHTPHLCVGAAAAVGLASVVTEAPVDLDELTAAAAIFGLNAAQAQALCAGAP